LKILTIFAAGKPLKIAKKTTIRMSQSNESFRRDLDELIRLFKKIKEKSGDDHFEQIDPMLKQHLDFVINNYEMVKDSKQVEMLNQMGFPVQQMLRQFIIMMKQDLGEDLTPDEPAETEVAIPTNESPNENPDDAIRRIDQLLQKTSLTEEQINDLLDKRNQLVNKKSTDLLK
jgi:hypothetical protein